MLGRIQVFELSVTWVLFGKVMTIRFSSFNRVILSICLLKHSKWPSINYGV